MNSDMLLLNLVDVIAPIVAVEADFFARAVLRLYLATGRQVSCDDIAATLGDKSADLWWLGDHAAKKNYTDREQVILTSAIETLLPEVTSGYLTVDALTQIIIKMTGGERDEVDVQEAIAEFQHN